MAKRHIIILGGYPGSGKSTVRGLLAKRLGYTMFSTGDFVRSLAHERGMTLEEFNEKVAGDKDLDLLIDAELEHIERDGDYYVVDSHLAFHFIPSGFSVYLSISPEVAAQRIFNDRHSEMRQKTGDVMDTIEESRLRTQKRIENHRERYMRHYGIDPYVPENYNFIADSETHSPDELVELIIPAFESWLSTP